MTERVVGVVPAAGRASRFGGVKVLAELEGRPLIEHVLERLRTAGIDRIVVVLGDAADVIEAGARWPSGTTRVRNPKPDQGLASSVQVGVAAARAEGEPDAIVLALGDQPRVSPSVIRQLLEAATDRPVVVPRYPDGGNPNPAVLRPPAFRLVQEAAGDRGLGPVLRAHPDLVLQLPVPGTNPDVDTPDDLAGLRSGLGVP